MKRQQQKGPLMVIHMEHFLEVSFTDIWLGYKKIKLSSMLIFLSATYKQKWNTARQNLRARVF